MQSLTHCNTDNGRKADNPFFAPQGYAEPNPLQLHTCEAGAELRCEHHKAMQSLTHCNYPARFRSLNGVGHHKAMQSLTHCNLARKYRLNVHAPQGYAEPNPLQRSYHLSRSFLSIAPQGYAEPNPLQHRSDRPVNRDCRAPQGYAEPNPLQPDVLIVSGPVIAAPQGYAEPNPLQLRGRQSVKLRSIHRTTRLCRA